MHIIEMTLNASVLIVLVVLIRALFLHRVPKKTFLLLWAIVVCRLLIPFSIKFEYNFYSVVNAVKNLFTTKTSNFLNTEIPNLSGAIHLPLMPETTTINTSTLLTSSFILIWLIGMMFCVLFFVTAYIKWQRKFSKAQLIKNDFLDLWLYEHPLRRSIKIRLSDRIEAPLTYGIFKPVILLPKDTNWTDEVQLRFILAHELVHIRRFDSLNKLILTAAVCIHWFNPFAWIMYWLANRDLELSCDESVIHQFGTSTKSTYALTLIEMAERTSKAAPLSSHFSKNAIEERIVAIMKLKKTGIGSMILALVLAIGVPTVFATSPKDTVPEYSYEDEQGEFIPQEENIRQPNKRKFQEGDMFYEKGSALENDVFAPLKGRQYTDIELDAIIADIESGKIKALNEVDDVQAYLDSQFPKLDNDEYTSKPTISTDFSFTNQNGVSDPYIAEK